MTEKKYSPDGKGGGGIALTKDMLQGLADLGYPKSMRNTIDYWNAEEIIKKQLSYKKIDIGVSEEEKTDEVKKDIEKDYRSIEHSGADKFKAVYNLKPEDLEKALEFDDNVNEKDDGGDTMLHIVVNMAFGDFKNAKRIIEMLKKKGVNIFLKNIDGLTAIDIAERRSEKTPEYKDIVDELKN